MKQGTPPGLRFVDEAMADLRRENLFRVRLRPLTEGATSFCSNDYLGLAPRRTPNAPAGSGASRLISGEHNEHTVVEGVAAALVLLPEALAFTSGYAANVGTLAALAGPDDLVVRDALNHASLVDGARLSRAHIEVVPHLDPGAVKQALSRRHFRRAFVVTESYFSMDADSPDLTVLRNLCDLSGAALVVDEAHALGVLGPEGRGLCAAAGIQPDVLIGTFGKAFGAGGAFVAGCPSLVAWLWNRARTFVFSTGLSPALAAAAAEGMLTAAREPERRERVLAAARRLREGLAGLGLKTSGFGHIVPWIIGDVPLALRLAERIRAKGIDIRVVRPPSVPAGTARIRFAVNAMHGDSAVDRLLSVTADVLADEPPK